MMTLANALRMPRRPRAWLGALVLLHAAAATTACDALVLDGIGEGDAPSKGSLPGGDAIGLQDGAPWPMRSFGPTLQARSPYSGPQTATLQWIHPAHDAHAIAHAAPTIAADGTVYMVEPLRVTAVQADGTLKWHFEQAPETSQFSGSSAVIGADGTLYIGESNGDRLWAIAPDGTARWSLTLAQVEGSPAIAPDGTIYVATLRDDATSLWAVTPGGGIRWQYDAGASVPSSPAVGLDGTVYVVTDLDEVHALHPDGTKRWVHALGEHYPLWSSPAVGDDGIVYVGSQEVLHAIKPDGTPHWQHAFQPVSANYSCQPSPAIGADGTVYFPALGALRAIAPDGTETWAAPIGTPGSAGGEEVVDCTPAIGADGTVYVAAGLVFAIASDGASKWVHPLPGDYAPAELPDNYANAQPAIGADGSLYVNTWMGLEAFRDN